MFPSSQTMSAKEKMELLEEAAKDGGWRKLKQEIIKYNELRAQIIEQMENKQDPLYQQYLKFYKATLTPGEFLKNRLKIYAICNQRAMQECLSVDEMVDVISYGHPQIQALISAPEDLITDEEPMN